MRQLSARDQMTQKLITIGYRMAFNNDQSPCKTSNSKYDKVDTIYKYICRKHLDVL